MFAYFDPMYFVFALPALILAMAAQWRVKAAVNKYSQVFTGRGQTGADAGGDGTDTVGDGVGEGWACACEWLTLGTMSQ